MAAITVHPTSRPGIRTVAQRPSTGHEHQPTNEVPGPDEHALARTAAAVGVALALLIGTVVASALGAGMVVESLANWFLTR